MMEKPARNTAAKPARERPMLKPARAPAARRANRGGASEPPSVPGHFLLGNIPDIGADPLAFAIRAQRDYGDLVRLRFPLVRGYLVAHPDDIKRVVQDHHDNYIKNQIDYRPLRRGMGNGLLTSDGAYWRSQRRRIQPIFHRERIARYGAIIAHEADCMAADWDQRARRGEPFDVAAEMSHIALNIVARALFGVDVSRYAKTIGESLTVMNESVGQPGFLTLFPFLPTRVNRRIRAAIRALDTVIGKMIEARRTGGDAQDDLLSLLLSAREATGRPLSDMQVRDEVATFLLAGHETTANALAWTWYLLGKHPQVQDKLRAEIDAIVGSRAPAAEDLPRLGYAMMVISETMRLYPPVLAFLRSSIDDDELSGYRIRRGSRVVISQYVTHRHPAFWPDPERFDPDRFTPQRIASRPKYAYFPFGGGPRTCIGNLFALTEMAIILCTLAQRYRVRLVPEHRVEVQPLLTPRPRYGIMIVAQPR